MVLLAELGAAERVRETSLGDLADSCWVPGCGVGMAFDELPAAGDGVTPGVAFGTGLAGACAQMSDAQITKPQHGFLVNDFPRCSGIRTP